MKDGWPLKLAALLACCLVASHAFADSQAEATAARIERLETLVAALEKRLSALEAPSGHQTVPAQDVPSPLASWRSLRKGMSKSKVQELLGEPEKIDAIGPLENWYWYGPHGSKVTFYDEKLYGWQEPK